jgi:MurNAc alpha-1-phosphate uridylyltransferase
VVNGDVYTDIDFGTLKLVPPNLAHLVMVNNPPQHAAGDFALSSGKLSADGTEKLTFSGIGIYQPSLFASIVRGDAAKLAPLLKAAMAQGLVSGSHHRGAWHDIGTPERLQALDSQLLSN